MNSKRLSATSLITAALALTLSPGCHHDQTASKPDGGKFSSKPEISETTRLENTQAAAGAHWDATLYCDHFDATALSSLGTAKLDLMLADSHQKNPIVVYLDVPADDKLTAREASVSQYLADHGGLNSGQIHIEQGSNPYTDYSSNPNLKNYDKTDTTGGSSGYGAPGAAGH